LLLWARQPGYIDRLLLTAGTPAMQQSERSSKCGHTQGSDTLSAKGRG